MKFMKAQSMFEMFVTVTMLLAFTVPIILLVISSSQLRLEDLSVFHGRTAVQQLSDTINEVYLEGPGSKRSFLIDLPSNTQNLTFSGNTVTLYLATESGPYQISHPIFANVTYFTIRKSGLAQVNLIMENQQVRVIIK